MANEMNLDEARERGAAMERASRKSAADALAHAKRNKDSRNADRARHWWDVADMHTADADALALLLVTSRDR